MEKGKGGKVDAQRYSPVGAIVSFLTFRRQGDESWGLHVQETRGKGKDFKETATSLFHRPPFCAVCDVIAGGVSQCMLGNAQVICPLGVLSALG